MIDSESVIKTERWERRLNMFQRVQTKEEHFGSSNYGEICEERNLMFVERNLNPSRFY